MTQQRPIHSAHPSMMTASRSASSGAVPAFRALFFPILEAASKETMTARALRGGVGARFGIPKRQHTRAYPSGTRNSFSGNFDVALSWLKSSGLLSQTKTTAGTKRGKGRSVIKVTAKGADVLVTRELPPIDKKLKNLDLTASPCKPSKINLSASEKAILEAIPSMEIDRLLTLWKQNVGRLGDPAQKYKHQGASRIMKAAEQEWQHRLAKIRLDPDAFTWPTTRADGGGGGIDLSSSPDDGMLSYLGYRVGRTQGVSRGVRRTILNRVVDGTLPPFGGLAYYDQWSTPGSAARLKKLAETIAAFARNAKRREKSGMRDAISDWEDDLAYLYETYYLQKFRFGWP